MDKLGGPSEGPFSVLRRSTPTIAIQLGDLVERVNINRLVKEPARTTVDTRRDLDATPEENARVKGHRGELLFQEIKEHMVENDESIWSKVDWNGDFAPTWKPRENIPEGLISRYLGSRGREEATREYEGE